MRVLFLISDTGGGHRAAANAVAAALKARDPSHEIMIEDALVKAAPFPGNHAPAIYNWGMRHARWLWASTFHLTNGRRRAATMAALGWPGMKRRLVKLIDAARPDVVVSPHPLLTWSAAQALRAIPRRIPLAIVVTDLVTGHATWYERRADLVCVPTQAAFDRARRLGVDPARLLLTGQPVHPRAAAVVGDRAELRNRFGWTTPVVLCVGGGDGMGNLGARVRALAMAGLPARIVCVCGRNAALRAELEAARFPTTVEVHGFVDNLHEMMAAADILVTKGGPGSVIEGCIAGLPVLVYDYIPGQEDGNVDLVRDRGIGDLVRDPAALPAAVRRFLDDPALRARAAAAGRAVAVPDSADRVARALLALR